MKFKISAVCALSVLVMPFADAKRPKKTDKEELSKVALLAMPDLQSVLGSAYQSPLELSDRAMPGSVIEVTDFGYRPVINGCVDFDPIESAFTNITMQSSLSGGVSFGIGGQGASVSASQSVGLKFISPYILGFEMAKFVPSEECRSTLQNYGSQHGLSNLVVVQEALFARINGCSEITASAEGKVKALGGEAAASATCQLFSNKPVAVGVRLVSVESFLGSVVSLKSGVSVEASPAASPPPAVVSPSRSVEVVEAQVDGLSGDLATRMAQLEEQRLAMEEQRLAMEEAEQARQVELERQILERAHLEAELERVKLEAQRPYQEKAKADWETVKVFAEKGDEFGKEALALFISEYGNVRLSISGQTFEVAIPEVAIAEQMLHIGQHEGFATVVVSGGRFMMGCVPGDGDCEGDESPRHEVMLWNDMEVMSTEVTQGLYASVMGSNPSLFSSCGLDCPVEQVSWFDAVTFANALSEKLGLSTCYRINGNDVVWSDLDCTGWRLPTEAEWEYLARGGEEHLYSGSNNVGDVAWNLQNSGAMPHPVGKKEANAFGLFDMNGNVWEWTWDWYDGNYYSSDSVIEPLGPSSGSYRVLRGGSWNDTASYPRSSLRFNFNPSYINFSLGFRLLRNSSPAKLEAQRPYQDIAEQMLHIGQYEGFETVVVSGGRFMMGCVPGDGDCYEDESPRHAVTISHDMEVMTTEVTQGLYASVMGSYPSRFKGEDWPVEWVTWFDAVTFANALSDKEGLSSCYRINGNDVVWSDLDCTGWRLPTEAEWEYLARGGEEHLYSGSSTIEDVAWYSDNSGSETHPVGQKSANAFGLYDMSGNVWEWTWDWYGDYSSASVTDPRGPSSGSFRVRRGGSWYDTASYARSSLRYYSDPSSSYFTVGFRFLRKK